MAQHYRSSLSHLKHAADVKIAVNTLRDVCYATIAHAPNHAS